MSLPNAYMGGTVGLPAEQAIPRQIIYEILPQLENLLMMLERMQLVWNVPRNEIPAKITAAALADEPLGDYAVKDWVRWGEALLKLQQDLQEEFTIVFPDTTEEETTLRAVLLTRYTPSV